MLSVQLQVARRDGELSELQQANDLLKTEIDNLLLQLSDAKREKEEARENLESALGKINEYELETRKLKNKVKLFSLAVNDFKENKTARNSGNKDVNAGDISKLQKSLKEKNKKLADSESTSRKLGQRLAELESQLSQDKDSLQAKLKKSNDRLNSKSKELKKVETSLKESEARVAELLKLWRIAIKKLQS